ncbi:hypothetical protein NEF87_000741 [Candidatus Lokiarchaeum ossiferum]|uniref:DUF2207 domain-containing protein n=1 Tax=Candidatus Lokiarchaeum ossiferum TaxID=2951803 RepID=A0ABY6HLS0_9ARCH|nr:hypothetical protein NEF87_000741 [Candidatus Lokiarchaeum sp. B-35]
MVFKKIHNKKHLFILGILVYFSILSTFKIGNSIPPLETDLEFSAGGGDYIIYYYENGLETSYETFETGYRKILFTEIQNSTEKVVFSISEFTNSSTIENCLGDQLENWTLTQTYKKTVDKSSTSIYNLKYLMPKDITVLHHLLQNDTFEQSQFGQERAEYFSDNRFIETNTLSITGTNYTAQIAWKVEFAKNEYSIISITRRYELEVNVEMEYNRANLLKEYSAMWSEQTIEDTGARKPVIHTERLILYTTSIIEPPEPRKGITGFPTLIFIGIFIGTAHILQTSHRKCLLKK